jgi:hypothetical protein
MSRVCLLLLLFFPNFLFSQLEKTYSISGAVYDSENEEPLFNVNVFLNGTTLGTASNRNGEFVIENIPAGKYTLVLSIIGFEVHKVDILISGDYNTVIELNPVAYTINEVSILDEENEEWQKQYKLFERTFLGTSENSKYCDIENKEIIDFHYNTEDKQFYAKASDWISIVNYSLGYRLYFYLNDYSLSRTGAIKYSGEVRFEELSESENIEGFDWENKRLDAFKGSLKHFLISVKNGKYLEEGFSTFETESPNWKYLKEEQLFNIDMNKNVSMSNESEFETNLFASKHIMIKYKNKPEEWKYYEHRTYRGSKLDKILDEQISWFWLPHTYTVFDNYGNISSGVTSIKLYGYWAWQRVADMLPFNYLP